MLRAGALLASALLLAAPAQADDPVVAYTIVNAREIAESLTRTPGDARRGQALYHAEERAGCPACHGLPGAAEARTAPDLAEVGTRLSPGEIRLWIVAPSVIAEDTAMPAYYAAGQRRGAEDPLYGGPILTAAEIEDLVTYLATLKGTD